MDPPSQVMSAPLTEFSLGIPSNPDEPAGLPFRLLTGMIPESIEVRGKPKAEKEGRLGCCCKRSQFSIEKLEKNIKHSIDAHGSKIYGGSSHFCQNPSGVKALRTKLPGGSLILGFFITFLSTNFSKMCLGVLFHPPPPSVILKCCSKLKTYNR
jgi:hypothetical protein